MGFSIDNASLVHQILDLLQNHFGEEVEFVFHDLSLDYEHTIVDIRNGHVTGRTIGDTGDILGLEVLGGSGTTGNIYNLINTTEDKRTLRSSTQFIRGSKGEICACIAINEDITKSIELERYLHNRSHGEGITDHLFHGNINQMLEYLIDSAQTIVGKGIQDMNKNDKMAFIDYLDRRGAFLISKSNVRVCEVLKISKFTLYNYLDTIRTNRHPKEQNLQADSI